MGWLKRELWTFCKAQLSAQAATICDFTLAFILAELCGWWYVWATFTGAVAGGIVNCWVNYLWVFNTEQLKKKYVAVKYLLVWTGSILLNTGGTYVLTETSGVYFIIAKAVMTVVVALLWNYQLQRLFVYRNTHLEERLHSRYHQQDKQ